MTGAIPNRGNVVTQTRGTGARPTRGLGRICVRRVRHRAQRRLGGRSWLAMLACAGTLLGAGVAAPSAQAGEYVVAMCNPGYSVLSHRFSFARNFSDPTGKFAAAVNCAAGQRGLQISLNGSLGTGKFARWITSSPGPGLHIVDWSASAHIVNDGGASGRICYLPDSGASQCQGGASGKFIRYSAATKLQDGRSLSFRLGCFKSAGCDRTNKPRIGARSVTLTIADRTKPNLSLAGDALSGGVKAGLQYLRVEAGDVDSGVRAISVEVNGVAYPGGVQPECARVFGWESIFTVYAPCPKELTNTIELNTEHPSFVQRGANTIDVCAEDVYTPGKLPANRVCERRTIDVDNSCPASTPGGELEAGVGTLGRQSATYTYGFAPKLVGRVADAGGAGVAGALACIEERPAFDGAEFGAIAYVRTNAAGVFAVPLDSGPSRSLRITYRSGSTISKRIVTIGMRARPSFSVSARRVADRGCVELRGVLPGPNNARRTIALQGRARGAGRWFIFDAASTRKRGRFTRRYCFRPAAASATFEFRALVKAQSRYPYLPGASKIRRVRLVVSHR